MIFFQSIMYSFLYPAQNQELIKALSKHGMTIFGMDCIPRLPRAKPFDAMSSMANIAGYRSETVAI